MRGSNAGGVNLSDPLVELQDICALRSFGRSSRPAHLAEITCSSDAPSSVCFPCYAACAPASREQWICRSREVGAEASRVEKVKLYIGRGVGRFNKNKENKRDIKRDCLHWKNLEDRGGGACEI